ncbi:MAG: hypothetical protein KDA83_21235, partial [Planctomycetales bacterium]|nr:hypothetical protein [Planctomycetales bacterium]
AKPIYDKLKTVHARLTLEEMEVPNIGALDLLFSADGGTPAEGTVSFETQIAPMLVGKCGRCHVSAARGGFQMATFEELMRGTAGGRVVLPGNGEGSRIVQVIEEGDMPRGGARVSDEELTALRTWISEGAQVAPESRQANLSVLAAAANGGEAPAEAPMLQFADGMGTVSFSLDVAPIIIDNCTGCHLDARNAQGRLNLETFAGWLRGGDSGAILAPGAPDDSLLVQKLRGTGGGDRMPRNRAPLGDDQIALIAKWIEEGAKFDGLSGDQDIREAYGRAKAAKATHEELSAERIELADTKWDLGLPNVRHEKIETENFLIVGNADHETLEYVAERAEQLAPGIVRLFRGQSREPFVKGRMTIYVFRGRYDYSEFGKMVERRQLPVEWTSHSQYDVIDQYAAILAPRENVESLEGPLVQQLSAGYLAAAGKNVPQWLSNGAGIWAVTKLVRDDPRIKEWEAALPDTLASMAKPDDFITGAMPEDRAALVASGMVNQMANDSRRWGQLMAALRRGDDFQAAFQALWGATPSEIVTGNWNQGSANPRRGR